MQQKNDLNWEARTANAILTNFKDKNDVMNSADIVKSPVDDHLKTAFYLADGTWLRTLDGAGGRWGSGSIPLGGNAVNMPLPEVMRVTYFDYYDNQFYQLVQTLPKEKIQQLFTQKHKIAYDGTLEAYDGLEIGFAPKGWIVLTASGVGGIRKEVGAWQAEKIEADYSMVVGLTRTADIQYLKKYDLRTRDINTEKKEVERKSPEIYKRWTQGKWQISADWYKRLQTKYPWNLEVTGDNIQWDGEYSISYANTEYSNVLDDQIGQDKNQLKAVPVKIGAWITYKPTGIKYYVEVHMFPIPKWSAERYIPYYNDPNLNYFIKRFEHLYPHRSLATNNQTVAPQDFATLKMHFNDDGILTEIYLQKGKDKLLLDGAYEYKLAPVDKERGGYWPQSGYPMFLTKPKIKDLTDPVFADRD